MEKQRVLILDKQRIAHKLRRMAYEIWEHNSNETEVTLAGVEGSGAAVANTIAGILKEISPLKVELLPIKINKKQPQHHVTETVADLTGKSVIFIDDVANSGKTMLYVLQPFLKYDIKKIMVAVLVDRSHKSYPISSDIVGHTVATTLQEHIEVEVQGDEVVAAYLQ